MYLRVITTLLTLLLTCFSGQATCIGVIPAGAEHMFWLEVIRGANTAAREEGIETYVRSPNTERNESGQILIINKALEEGCKGIMLAPNSDDVLSQVPELGRKKTPVVYFDRDMGGNPTSVVKTDNFAAGYLAGRELVKRMNGRGRVALLRMRIEVTSTTQREAGFIKALEGTDVKIVHDQHIGTTVEEAREVTSMMILSGLQTDAIFTPNEATTIGAMLSLKRLGLAGKIHHVGFDFTPLLMRALNTGEISGLIVQQPYLMGYTSAKTLIHAMKGEEVPGLIDIPAFYVDADNVASPEIQDIVDVGYE